MVLRLPHGETRGRLMYSMPDPDSLYDAYIAVRRWHYYGERKPTEKEIASVLMLAQGYLDLTTYTLGQEHCVRKLRDVWRARKRGA